MKLKDKFKLMSLGKMFLDHINHQAHKPSDVIFLGNNNTEEFIVYTKGNYRYTLIPFIKSLNKVDLKKQPINEHSFTSPNTKIHRSNYFKFKDKIKMLKLGKRLFEEVNKADNDSYAVVYLENNDTDELIVYTIGECKNELRHFVENTLNKDLGINIWEESHFVDT